MAAASASKRSRWASRSKSRLSQGWLKSRHSASDHAAVEEGVDGLGAVAVFAPGEAGERA